MKAQENVRQATGEMTIEEAAADKGYHAADEIELADSLSLRTYIPEPERKHKRRWTDKPAELKRAVYANRRRTQTDKSKRLQRLRSERVERSFAHVCQTGGARRTRLCGIEKVRKRYLIAAAARNLSAIMRTLFGIGTPRGLQTKDSAASFAPFTPIMIQTLSAALRCLCCDLKSLSAPTLRYAPPDRRCLTNTPISTGCYTFLQYLFGRMLVTYASSPRDTRHCHDDNQNHRRRFRH
jgi:hypothetical protein